MENGDAKTFAAHMDYDSENSLTIDSDDDVDKNDAREDYRKLGWPRDSFLPEADLDPLDMNMENKNTLRKTDTDIRILISYLKSKNEPRPPETIPPMDLDRYLSTFFTVVKKHDGNDYEPASLRGMLCSVERYLKLKNYPASVTRDYIFSNTRNALKLKQQRLRDLGKGNKRPMESFGQITSEKVDHLFKAKEMGPYTPMSVVNTLCFAIIVQFRLRKAIDHKNMLWGHVTLKKDLNGRECLCYKPLSPQIMRKEHDNVCLPSMTDDTEKDTIQIYKLYAEKRPSNMNYANAPFYLGITTIYPSAVQAWYRTCAMGVNKLSDLVRMIRAMTGLPRASVQSPMNSLLMKRQYDFSLSKISSKNKHNETGVLSKTTPSVDSTDMHQESTMTSLKKIYTDVDRDDGDRESVDSSSGLSSCSEDSKEHTSKPKDEITDKGRKSTFVINTKH